MSDLYRGMRTPAAPGQAGDVAAPSAPATDVNQAAAQRKNADRFGAGQPSASSPVAVSQHAVLLEEDPGDPQGKHSVGSVVWRTEAVSSGNNRAPELAIRADIEIPERRIGVALTIKRETDPSRSLSHTIEVVFKLPTDFAPGGISNVPGIWMKPNEQAQGGFPLNGGSFRVTTNYFLVGLSAAATDRDRNIQLLKDQPWIDIAIVYANNKRAILSLEKGEAGTQAFAAAFAAWEQTPTAGK
jgi:hypothetical protein